MQPSTASSAADPDQASADPRPAASLAPLVPLGGVDDAAKRRDLVRMKLVATGFLLGATVVFLVGRFFEVNGAPGWVGYIRAAGEAGMIGALADWFAVTALFRRPLGLPIPHTAIIPTKKDQLGDSLGDFVGENFLSESVVRDRLARAQLSARVGTWLRDPEHAERVTAELATAARAAVTVLRDEDVQEMLEEVLVRELMTRQWGPPLGRVLEGVLADGSHHRLVDLLLDRAYDWIVANQEAVLAVVEDRSPSWSPKFLDEMVADKVYSEVQTFAFSVRNDPEHPLRKAIDTFLSEFASDMQHDPATIERAEEIKGQVFANPEVENFIGQAWATIKTMLLDAAEDPSSELRRRMTAGLISLGQRLSTDGELQSKLDNWVQEAAGYVVRHYRDEILTLITETVQRWDAEETSRKVELQVGRDLQFIRINGTVVGALAGLVIYAVSQLLF